MASRVRAAQTRTRFGRLDGPGFTSSVLSAKIACDSQSPWALPYISSLHSGGLKPFFPDAFFFSVRAIRARACGRAPPLLTSASAWPWEGGAGAFKLPF